MVEERKILGIYTEIETRGLEQHNSDIAESRNAAREASIGFNDLRQGAIASSLGVSVLETGVVALATALGGPAAGAVAKVALALLDFQSSSEQATKASQQSTQAMTEQSEAAEKLATARSRLNNIIDIAQGLPRFDERLPDRDGPDGVQFGPLNPRPNSSGPPRLDEEFFNQRASFIFETIEAIRDQISVNDLLNGEQIEVPVTVRAALEGSTFSTSLTNQLIESAEAFADESQEIFDQVVSSQAGLLLGGFSAEDSAGVSEALAEISAAYGSSADSIVSALSRAREEGEVTFSTLESLASLASQNDLVFGALSGIFEEQGRVIGQSAVTADDLAEAIRRLGEINEGAASREPEEPSILQLLSEEFGFSEISDQEKLDRARRDRIRVKAGEIVFADEIDDEEFARLEAVESERLAKQREQTEELERQGENARAILESNEAIAAEEERNLSSERRRINALEEQIEKLQDVEGSLEQQAKLRDLINNIEIDQEQRDLDKISRENARLQREKERAEAEAEREARQLEKQEELSLDLTVSGTEAQLRAIEKRFSDSIEFEDSRGNQAQADRLRQSRQDEIDDVIESVRRLGFTDEEARIDAINERFERGIEFARTRDDIDENALIERRDQLIAEARRDEVTAVNTGSQTFSQEFFNRRATITSRTDEPVRAAVEVQTQVIEQGQIELFELMDGLPAAFGDAASLIPSNTVNVTVDNCGSVITS